MSKKLTRRGKRYFEGEKQQKTVIYSQLKADHCCQGFTCGRNWSNEGYDLSVPIPDDKIHYEILGVSGWDTVTCSLESKAQELQDKAVEWVVCNDTALRTGVSEESGPPARSVFNKGHTGGLREKLLVDNERVCRLWRT